MKKRTTILKLRMKKLSLFLVCMIFSMGIIPTTFAYADGTKLIETKNGTINSRQMGKEGPSIIFESGYGDALKSEDCNDIWNGIQDAAAQYAKTIAYDRFGLGESSDIGNMPSLTTKQRQTILDGGNIKYKEKDFNGQYKTARDKAINLHNLLDKAKIKKPYVLVAHSIGSFTAIEFAKLYKNDVAGIVMLDGTFPDANEKAYEWMKNNMPDAANNFDAQFCNADGNIDEVLISGLQCKRDIKDLKNIPILYLQSCEVGMGEEFEEMRNECISNMLSNFRFSKRITVPNSTHYVHWCNPEFVNDAIENFVKDIKEK
jgi:pimeloyl-ACP methyl ester carboxylesterase